MLYEFGAYIWRGLFMEGLVFEIFTVDVGYKRGTLLQQAALMFIGLELTVKNGKRAFLCIVIFFLACITNGYYVFMRSFLEKKAVGFSQWMKF